MTNGSEETGRTEHAGGVSSFHGRELRHGLLDPEECLRRVSEVIAVPVAGTEPDDRRRTRLQNGVYGERLTPNYHMVRVKFPAGRITPLSFRKLAEIADRYSPRSIHVTTREDIQLHWVKNSDVPGILQLLKEGGMTSREACFNSVRNVVCDSLAGVRGDEPFDVTPYAKAVASFFLYNPMSQNLPRKFKINFSSSESDDAAAARISDIGLFPAVARENGEEKRGFRIFFGGGLGLKAFIAEPLEDFTSEEMLLSTCASIVKIYDRCGDREHPHRNRMRYLVRDIGIEKFRKLVLAERAVLGRLDMVLPPIPHVAGEGSDLKTLDNDDFRRWLAGNVAGQKQKGFYCVYIMCNGGEFTRDQLVELADLTEHYSGERETALTIGQAMVIRYVEGAHIPELYRRLSAAGLADGGATTIVNAVGCTGTTSCNLAITNSRMLAKVLQKALYEKEYDLDPRLKNVAIKISGCPNGCGQHTIGTIGFMGSGMRLGQGGMAPHYQMLLGGRLGPNPALGTPFLRVPAKLVPKIIVELIDIFREKAPADQDFNQWIDRVVAGGNGVTLEYLKQRVKALVGAQPQTTDMYVDWGDLIKFRIVTSRGECAP